MFFVMFRIYESCMCLCFCSLFTFEPVWEMRLPDIWTSGQGRSRGTSGKGRRPSYYEAQDLSYSVQEKNAKYVSVKCFNSDLCINLLHKYQTFANICMGIIHNSPHHNLSSTSYQQTCTRSHPSLHSLRQKSLHSSFPVILLLVRLILFHLISFKQFLLQLYLHSLKSLTHSFTLEFFPQHLNRLV